MTICYRALDNIISKAKFIIFLPQTTHFLFVLMTKAITVISDFSPSSSYLSSPRHIGFFSPWCLSPWLCLSPTLEQALVTSYLCTLNSLLTAPCLQLALSPGPQSSQINILKNPALSSPLLPTSLLISHALLTFKAFHYVVPIHHSTLIS